MQNRLQASRGQMDVGGQPEWERAKTGSLEFAPPPSQALPFL